MIEPLTDLIENEGFRTGALCGLATSLAVALAVVVGRRPLRFAGVAFSAAALLALADLFDIDAVVVAGIALLAAGGHLAATSGPVAQLAAAVPGVVLVARDPALRGPGWAVPTVVGATLVGGLLMARFDADHRPRAMGPVLLAMTALGVYVAMPETTLAAIVLGAASPLVLLGFPWPLAPLGAGGAWAAVAVLAWVVVVEGQGRVGAVVGGLGCLGMLALDPVVRWAVRRAGGLTDGIPLRQAATIAAVHVALVAACAGLAGRLESAVAALALCLAAASVAAGVAAVVVRRTTPPRVPVAA